MTLWLTAAEAARHTKRHPRTITDAARAKELHGVQGARNKSWRFNEECVDAWVAGETCEHQKNVTQIGRRARKSA